MSALPRFRGINRRFRRFRWPERIEAVVTDVDGCLTDGRVFYPQEGAPLRAFNTKDGVGHDRLRKAGIKVAWLTSGKLADSTRLRSETIGVDAIDIGSGPKGPRLERLCADLNVALDHVVYLGDDSLDLDAMAMVGLSACPADASADVRRQSDLILHRAGGDACFRELAELVLTRRRG